MTTLQELKKKRTLQREAEAAAKAEQERKAQEGSESSRKAKALLRQPRKLAMIFGGGLLALALVQGLILGGFYLLSQSRLNTYYESLESGDFPTAAEALEGYLAHNADDWQLQSEYAILLLKLDRAEEAEIIFLNIQEQSPDSFSTDMQFYAALSNFKFKNVLLEGLEAVLESVPNFLPAQLGMGVIALDDDPAEALVLFAQAKERLTEMSTGSDIYERSKSQINSFVNIACTAVPDIFNYISEDPASRNQRGEAAEMFKFSYGVLSDSDQYIYGLDNSLFFNFCGITRQRITEENWQDADLRALFGLLYGYAYAVAGDYENSRNELANSRAYLELPESIFLEGIVALSEYNYQLAEDTLTPLRQSDDQAAMLAFAHALLHQEPEKWPGAKGLLSKAIEGNLEMAAVALNNRGVLNLVENLPGQARNDFNSALKNRTGYPHAEFNTAVAHLVDGKCPTALTKFDELYTAGHVFPGIRYYSAVCYKEAGQTSQAQSDLNYAVKDPYFNAYAHAALGDIYSEKELFTEVATENYFTAHSLQPDNYEIGFKLAESMSRGGQPVAASNLIDNIIEEVGEKHAQDKMYQVLRDAALGQVKYELGEEAALQYLTSAYENAEEIQLKVRLGVKYASLLVNEGELSKADSVTREMLALVPENTRVLISRARVLLASRNIGQAVEMVRGALTRDQGNFELQMTAGDVLESAGEIDAALDAYKAAHEIEPGNIAPLNRRLAVLQEHQPSSSKIPEVEALIKNNQRIAASRGAGRHAQKGGSENQRTVALGSLIRDPEAQARTKEQIEKLSADIESGTLDEYSGYQNRAALHVQLGDYDSALADFQLASNISPDAALPWKNMASLHLQGGRYQDATDAYNKAIDLDSDDTRLYFAWAQSRSFYVGSEQSILDFTRVLEKDPLNANAYVSRGKAFLDVEQYDQAINDFTQALQYDAENVCAYELRSKVYTLIGQIEKATNDIDTLTVLRGGDLRVQGLNC